MRVRIPHTIALGMSLLMAGCGTQAESTKSILHGEEGALLALGSGVNTLTGEITANCVTQDLKAILNQKSTPITLSVIRDRQQLSALIELDLAHFAGPRTGIDSKKTFGELNMPARIGHALTFSPRISHVLISVERIDSLERFSDNPQIIGKPRAPNLPALSHYNKYVNNFPGFVETCGDSFVSEVKHGDFGYAIVSVIHDSQEKLEAFPAEVPSNTNDIQPVLDWLNRYPQAEIKILYPRWDNAVKPGDAARISQLVREVRSGTQQTYSKPFVTRLKPYQNIEPYTTPGQQTWSQSVASYKENARDLIAAQSCSAILQAATESAAEYQNTADFANELAMLPIVKNFIDYEQRTLETCEKSKSCERGFKQRTDSALTEADYNATKGFARSCLSTPKLNSVDGLAYLKWRQQGGATGALGTITGPSELINGSVAQPFANAVLARENKPVTDAMNQIHELMQLSHPQYQYMKSRSDLGVIRGATSNFGVPVLLFANARIFHMDAGTGADRFIYTNRTYPYLTQLPAQDETYSSVGSDQDGGLLQTIWRQNMSETIQVDGTATFFYSKWSMLRPGLGGGNTTAAAQLNSYGAIYGHWKSLGGASWAAPRVSETWYGSGVGGWYAEFSNGQVIWFSEQYKITVMPLEFMNVYKTFGGPNSKFGLPKKFSTFESKVQFLEFERGALYKEPGKPVKEFILRFPT